MKSQFSTERGGGTIVPSPSMLMWDGWAKSKPVMKWKWHKGWATNLSGALDQGSSAPRQPVKQTRCRGGSGATAEWRSDNTMLFCALNGRLKFPSGTCSWSSGFPRLDFWVQSWDVSHQRNAVFKGCWGGRHRPGPQPPRLLQLNKKYLLQLNIQALFLFLLRSTAMLAENGSRRVTDFNGAQRQNRQRFGDESQPQDYETLLVLTKSCTENNSWC